MKTERKYGWLKQADDVRDFLYRTTKAVVVPAAVDMRGTTPKIYDQEQLGSCVGNGCVGVAEHRLMVEGVDFLPSRLMAYYNARTDKKHDTGATIRDGIKGLAKYGVCHEAMYPYDIAKFMVKPSAAAYIDAGLHKIEKYEAVGQSLNELQAAIAMKNPVVFGMYLKTSFQSKATEKTGRYVPKGKIEGGHCMVLEGYNNDKYGGSFLTRNSWGETWGEGGYVWIPYAEILNPNIASDFWVVDAIA